MSANAVALWTPWASWSIPDLPEPGLSDRERKHRETEMTERLKSLQRELASEQLRLAALKDQVTNSIPGPRGLYPRRLWIQELPYEQHMALRVEDIKWLDGLSPARAPARASVTLANCHTRIAEIQEEIRGLQAAAEDA